MNSRSHRLWWCCFILLLFLMTSCSSTQSLKKPEGEKEFIQETSRLEKLTRENTEPSVLAQSHLKLAFLFVNWRNPRLNYARALQEMGSYLALSPGKVQTDDVQNWFAVLRELDHLGKDKIRLQASLEKVQKENKNLRNEVANLREMIERLKNLDRQMEEKRGLTK